MEFSGEELDLFIQFFRREYLPKKSFFIRAGQITNQKAYLNKGCARTFTIDEKGREHILHFAFEDWWLADYESYMTGKPGIRYVQAIEDCELLCISKEDWARAEEQIPKLKKWYERKQSKMVFSTMQQVNDLKALTVEERYMNLTHKHPDIFQRVPLQYIAAFLDIEPPSLSRLRKLLSGK